MKDYKLDLSTPYTIVLLARGASKTHTTFRREDNLRVRMPKIYYTTDAELRRAFKSEENFKKFIVKIKEGGYTQIMLKRNKNEG